jgi:hypothetical protein
MSLIFKISGALVFLCPFATRARICKRLRSPEIDSEECPLRITVSKILIANDYKYYPCGPSQPSLSVYVSLFPTNLNPLYSYVRYFVKNC